MVNSIEKQISMGKVYRNVQHVSFLFPSVWNISSQDVQKSGCPNVGFVGAYRQWAKQWSRREIRMRFDFTSGVAVKDIYQLLEGLTFNNFWQSYIFILENLSTTILGGFNI